MIIGKEPTPLKIEKFLGLNISNTGDTQIQLGESGDMTNFFITNDYKLRKMYGYKTFYDFGQPVRGMYSTNLGGNEYLLIAVDGKLYYFTAIELADEANWDTLIPHEIGSIPDTETSFFTFNKKVYILCGKYMSWDGQTLQEVEGYTPLVFINTPPAGGGLVYEELNILSSKKHQTFNGDGTSTVYHLAQKNIESVDKVTIGGDEQETSTYTVNTTNGTVTFNTAPAQGMDNVDIYWTLDDGTRDIIEDMRFGTIFGGDLDTRVFLYGNEDCQNRTYYSGLEDGEPSVEYFPASNFVDVGPSNFALTDLTRQYDRLLATTNRPEAYYMTIGLEKLDVTLSDNSKTTRYVSSVSTFPLNEIHGNFANGQGQLIDNNPVTFDKNALIMWKATNVRDERNMEDISQKIRLDLINIDSRMIRSLDHQSENQLWFGANDVIYIYNYYNKTYSRIKIPVYLRHFADVDNSVYMGTNMGQVMKWGDQFDKFDDTLINAHWEMNFSDFGEAYRRKTMNRLWVLMQPQAKSSADIGYVTNRAASSSKKHIQYNIQVLDNVNFASFSFEMSTNPQPFRLKMKAKKFTNLKITIDNNEETDCTILQLVLKVESFGESK